MLRHECRLEALRSLRLDGLSAFVLWNELAAAEGLNVLVATGCEISSYIDKLEKLIGEMMSSEDMIMQTPISAHAQAIALVCGEREVGWQKVVDEKSVNVPRKWSASQQEQVALGDQALVNTDLQINAQTMWLIIFPRPLFDEDDPSPTNSVLFENSISCFPQVVATVRTLHAFMGLRSPFFQRYFSQLQPLLDGYHDLVKMMAPAGEQRAQQVSTSTTPKKTFKKTLKTPETPAPKTPGQADDFESCDEEDSDFEGTTGGPVTGPMAEMMGAIFAGQGTTDRDGVARTRTFEAGEMSQIAEGLSPDAQALWKQLGAAGVF